MIFSNNSGSGVTSPNGTTLGADMSVNGITLQDTANTITLNQDGYTLTIGGGGINLIAGQQNAIETINTPLSLSAAQTWTNNTPAAANLSNNALTVNGNVANNGNTLGVNAFAGNNVNIGGAISGGGGLVKYGGQTLTLTGANWYGGPTSIFGGTLALSGNVATINQSSSIVFNNGGALLLTNAVVEGGVNRVNAVPINSYGGNIQYNNTTGAGIVYAQNLGAATLYNGEFDVILNNNQSGAGNTQTLTLPGLTQNTTSGAPVITFSAPGTAPNNSTNVIQNTSISSATAANTIIGPWATVGFANNQQSDYSVYNAAGQIVPANIAATTDTSWTTAVNSYTFSAGDTLAATRTINSLRYTGGNNSLVLGNFNLQTCGVLYAGSNNQTLTISAGAPAC